MHCAWCGAPISGAEWEGLPNGRVRCADGASCALRAGEVAWGANPRGENLPGRYCCTDSRCTHPREQVFNGGGG